MRGMLADGIERGKTVLCRGWLIAKCSQKPPSARAVESQGPRGLECPCSPISLSIPLSQQMLVDSTIFPRRVFAATLSLLSIRHPWIHMDSHANIYKGQARKRNGSKAGLEWLPDSSEKCGLLGWHSVCKSMGQYSY